MFPSATGLPKGYTADTASSVTTAVVRKMWCAGVAQKSTTRHPNKPEKRTYTDFNWKKYYPPWDQNRSLTASFAPSLTSVDRGAFWTNFSINNVFFESQESFIYIFSTFIIGGRKLAEKSSTHNKIDEGKMMKGEFFFLKKSRHNGKRNGEEKSKSGTTREDNVVHLRITSLVHWHHTAFENYTDFREVKENRWLKERKLMMRLRPGENTRHWVLFPVQRRRFPTTTMTTTKHATRATRGYGVSEEEVDNRESLGSFSVMFLRYVHMALKKER